jgi:gliding motility-associated lipoprotein GldH
MRVSLLLIWMGLFFLAACDQGRVYEYDQEFKEQVWKSADTATFEFSIHDIGKKYNIFYNIRNSLEFPYARLFVNYSLEDSAGAVLGKKLISEFLFDQKTGKPFGDSGLGDIYDHQFPILKSYEFRYPGKYKLKLEQFMRTDTLKGVLAVGARIEQAKTE